MVPRVMHVAGGRKRRGRGLPLVKLRPGFQEGGAHRNGEKKFKKIHVVAATSRNSRNSIRIIPAASVKIPDGRPHEMAKPLPVFYLWSDFNLDSHQSNQSIFIPLFPLPFVPFPGISGLILPINTRCIRIILSFFSSTKRTPSPAHAPSHPRLTLAHDFACTGNEA